MMLDRIVEVFCEVDDFCQAFVPQWEASLLGTGGPAPREPGLTPSEIITLLLTVQVSNISRASITASPSRWLLSWHALLRALRHPSEKRLRAAGVLPPQPPGDRALLHRLHRPCDTHRLNRHLPVWPSAARWAGSSASSCCTLSSTTAMRSSP